MSISTFAELKSAISRFLDRDDLSDDIENFIDLAEARHRREIRIREMLSRSTLAIAEDDRYVDLPSDFLDLKYIRLQIPTTNSGRMYFPDFEEVTTHELTQKSIKNAKRPQFFSVDEQIQFDSKADQAYTAEIFYYVAFTALSDVDTTNDLLTLAPDAYLFAALAESAPYLMNDERIQVWESRYVAARDALNVTNRMNRRGGPLTVRVAGSTP